MRSVILLSAGFVLLALLWAVYAPFAARGWVQALDDGERAPAEQALLRAGADALPALYGGLHSTSLHIRLRCARMLALRNDPEGETALLEILRVHGEHGDDTAAAAAETCLLALWDHTGPAFTAIAPDAAIREKLARLEATHADAELIGLLSQCLARDPAWIGGYVRRAHANLRAGEAAEARHDALMALALDYNEFEAMSVLAQASLLLNDPQDADTCMQQALRVNPRLKRDLREEIRDVLKALDAEKERQRREKRGETPEV